MEEIKKLELLSEDIQNEVEELRSLLERSDDFLLKAKRASFQRQLENITSNLEQVNNAVYGVYEELNMHNTEQLQEDYNVLHDILQEKLTHDEKVDIRIKHRIDLY